MPPRSTEIERVQPRSVRYLECVLSTVRRLFPRCATATLTTAVAFTSYLGVGTLAVALGAYTPGYAFATHSDPVFSLLGTALGALTCLTMGSLVVLTWFCNADDPHASIVISMSIVGLGCGGALFRMTVSASLTYLSTVLL